MNIHNFYLYTFPSELFPQKNFWIRTCSYTLGNSFVKVGFMALIEENIIHLTTAKECKLSL